MPQHLTDLTSWVAVVLDTLGRIQPRPHTKSYLMPRDTRRLILQQSLTTRHTRCISCKYCTRCKTSLCLPLCSHYIRRQPRSAEIETKKQVPAGCTSKYVDYGSHLGLFELGQIRQSSYRSDGGSKRHGNRWWVSYSTAEVAPLVPLSLSLSPLARSFPVNPPVCTWAHFGLGCLGAWVHSRFPNEY